MADNFLKKATSLVQDKAVDFKTLGEGIAKNTSGFLNTQIDTLGKNSLLEILMFSLIAL